MGSPGGWQRFLAQHISEPGAPPAASSSEVPAWKKLTAEREFSLFSKAGPATEITPIYCLALWRSFGKCLYQPISWIYYTFYVPATMGTGGSFIPFFFFFLFLTMAHLKNTFFFFFAMPCIMWDLNSPTRIKSAPPAEEVWRLNHETAREVPGLSLLKASHRLVPQEKAPDHRLVFTSFTHQPHVPFQSHIWRSPL